MQDYAPTGKPAAALKLLLNLCLAGSIAGCQSPQSNTASGSGNGGSTSQTACPIDDCSQGVVSAPIAEPNISGQPAEQKCVTGSDGKQDCKPTAGSMALLPDNRVLYFNALENTENVQANIVAEFGFQTVNDQSRVLTIGANDSMSWANPSPVDGGANPDGRDSLTQGPSDANDKNDNDGALFCSDLIQLPDGRIFTVGGTDYYTENGAVELEGLDNGRVFSAGTNQWTQVAPTAQGRWYPTLVSLPDNRVFIASGVTKLLKPVYPETRPPEDSGRNVAQSETYDIACDSWTDNGVGGTKSLPLYPRLHLLPNGMIYYNAGGQAFNPFGQAYDQALWNLVSVYDPASQTWQDLAFAGLDVPLNAALLALLTQPPQFPGPDGLFDPATPVRDRFDMLQGLPADMLPNTGSDLSPVEGILGPVLSAGVLPTAPDQLAGLGFRGSTASIMLPLVPDENGDYNRAEFLTAGGVVANVTLPSPGGYNAVTSARIDSIDINGAELDYGTRPIASLNQPRWYSTGIMMPDGSVTVFSGSDRDEVVSPAVGIAITTPERYDPVADTWTDMAPQTQQRTYHNTALLLADGRVLIGGHAPIPNNYTRNQTIPGFSPNEGRDPTFEIYSPPYVFEQRPVIDAAPTTAGIGDVLNISSSDAADITRVLLIRRTAMTHLIDADQRAVELPITSRNATGISVQMPAQQAVVPAGHYMLFISRDGDNGPVPSVSAPLLVTGPPLTCAS